MRIHYLIPLLAAVALLSSCAEMEAAPKPLTPIAAIAEAELVFKAGRHEQAFTMLQTTAFAYPLDKSPWIRMAQLRFERGQYGEAINHAAHAVELDPDDKLAHTILAVSGLRVSSKALTDLARYSDATIERDEGPDRPDRETQYQRRRAYRSAGIGQADAGHAGRRCAGAARFEIGAKASDPASGDN